MKMNRSEIEEIFEGCPYCGKHGSLEDGRACCGEVHFCQLVALKNGDVEPLDEVEIIEDACPDCESPDIMRTGQGPETFMCHDCTKEWAA